MENAVLRDMERAVSASFEAVTGEEFAFLGERRRDVLSSFPLFMEKIEALDTPARSAAIRTAFTTLDPDVPLSPDCRHGAVSLAPRAGDELSFAVVHGSFDPFHLGHLFMGFNAVADHSCDFAIFMPNADSARGGSSLKRDKSPFAWRTRTALEGGVDDLYPALRLSSFGERGGTVDSHARLLAANRDTLIGYKRVRLWIVLGSDILHRQGFVEWTNSTYRSLLDAVRLSHLSVRFRIVERPGYSLLRDRLDALDFPWISVPEVSIASSTAIRTDPVRAVWLYPREVMALEAYLLYGKKQRD